MNLDELRSVRDTERKKSDLQSLRESFYEEAGEYVAQLKEQRDRAAARADNPFSDPEVQQLTDEIETAEEVVEAIYERRMGKVLDRASLAAANMTVDEEGLTAEEQKLFQDVVARIRDNKQGVLASLDPGSDGDGGSGGVGGSGEGSGGGSGGPGSGSGPSGGRENDGSGISAADAMGGADDPGTDPEAGRESTASPSGTDPATGGDSPATARAESGGTSDGVAREPDGGTPPADDRSQSSDPEHGDGGTGRGRQVPDPDAVSGPPDRAGGEDGGDEGPDRVTVLVTSDVDEFLGVDDRQYNLAAEDVVHLPERNAEPLVQRGAAERIQ